MVLYRELAAPECAFKVSSWALWSNIFLLLGEYILSCGVFGAEESAETFVSADRIGAHFAYRRRLITGGGFFGVALDDSRSFKHGVILGFGRRKCGERGGKEKNNISGIGTLAGRGDIRRCDGG